MTVARTFRFPGGSLILYSHPNGTGELVLYSKKKIDFKVFGDFEVLEKEFDNLVQSIEKEFVEIVREIMRYVILKM